MFNDALKNGIIEFTKGTKEFVSDLPKNIQKLNDNIEVLMNGIKKVVYYIVNPIELAKILWQFTVVNSFNICLVICICGLILYVIGVKKGAKWAKVSFFSYLTIQVFNAAMR